MKFVKFIFSALITLSIGLCANAWAAGGQFGASQPIADKDGWTIGAGYFFNHEQVKIYDTYHNMQQNLAYAQATKSFATASSGNYEIYGRIGSADLLLGNYFKSDSPDMATSKNDLDSDTLPFATVGLKAFFPATDILGVGGFIQGTYFFGKFKDDMNGAYKGVPFFSSTEVDNMYNISLGWSVQAKLPYDIKVYAGPSLSWTRADVTDSPKIPTPTTMDSSLKNKSNFGAFAGASFQTLKWLDINIEGQFSDKVSCGASVSFIF